MKSLGTILPTTESIRISDNQHRKDERRKSELAASAGLNNGVMVGLETQYPDKNGYAIVNSRFQIVWFDVRPDGTYRRK